MALRSPRSLKGLVLKVNLVHFSHDLGCTIPTIRAVRLKGLKTVDIQLGHVEIGKSIDDPVGNQPTNPTALQDAEGVEPSRHEEVPQFGRLSHQGREVGGEALGAAEELPNRGFTRSGNPLEGVLEIRDHPIHVRIEVGKRKRARHPVQ